MYYNNMITRWGFSSAGRASALHAEGQEFESPNLHHLIQVVSTKLEPFGLFFIAWILSFFGDGWEFMSSTWLYSLIPICTSFINFLTVSNTYLNWILTYFLENKNFVIFVLFHYSNFLSKVRCLQRFQLSVYQ